MVIRKRISLEFLGELYKDAYLEFTGISLGKYEGYLKQIDSFKDDNTKSVKFIIETLQSHFLSGKFPDEKGVLQDVSKDEIPEIDLSTAIKVFSLLTGQELLPK